MRSSLRSHTALAAAALALALVAGTSCSSDEAADTGTTTTTAAESASRDSEPTDDPIDRGRVVALGEEFLLADLLALGVKPIASTATVVESGFQGIEADTSGIEPLPSYEADFERLAGLQPDTIIASPFIIEQAGRDKLEAIGELLEMPDRATPTEQITALGEMFGVEAKAAELVAALAQDMADAKAEVPADCSVSLGTIYGGPTLAAWIDAPNAAATVLLDLGCALLPSTDTQTPDQSGRVYLSEEQLELLAGPKLVLLQTGTVDGEDAARATVEQNPLWALLPAVAADQVTVLDRLGYPGVDGQRRLVADLLAVVTA